MWSKRRIVRAHTTNSSGVRKCVNATYKANGRRSCAKLKRPTPALSAGETAEWTSTMTVATVDAAEAETGIGDEMEIGAGMTGKTEGTLANQTRGIAR